MNRIFLILFFLFFISFPPKVILADTDITNSWIALQNLPYAIASHGITSQGNRLYILGGASTDDTSNVIQSLQNSDGTLSNWINFGNLSEEKYWSPLVKNHDTLYLLGGSQFTGTTLFLNKVFYSQVNQDGSLSSWQTTTPLPNNLSLGAAVISGDYIFFSGGFNNNGDSKKVYSSHIKQDGSLDNWVEVSELPVSRIGHGMIENNGYIYVLGGSNANQVYKATVNSDGTISSWVQISTLPEKLYRASYTKIGSQIYVVGGHNGSVTINKIYYTTINTDGSLQSWVLSANALPLPVHGGGIAQVGSYLYLTGGFRSPQQQYLNSVYMTKLNLEIEPNLSVPNLKQTDPEWGSQVYDHASLWSSGKTGIDRWGCALTSAAMVFSFHGIKKLPDGKQLNPGNLNTWLKSQSDGYIDNGYINWNALSRLSKIAKFQNPDFQFEALENNRIGGFAKIQLEKDLKDDIPGILEVPSHFVVAKGKSNGLILINDPFYDRNNLSPYGNTFNSLRRFVPSNTDLSSILIVAPKDVTVLIKDKDGNTVGEGYIQEPVNDDIGGGNIPNAIYLYEYKKPESGNYSVNISSSLDQQYEMKQYIYDKNGGVKEITQKGVTGSKDDMFLLTFHKEKAQESTSKEIVSYDNLIFDLDFFYSKKLIANLGVYKALKEKALKAKKYAENNKKLAKSIMNSFIIQLDSNQNKTLKFDAYTVLKYQAEALYNLL